MNRIGVDISKSMLDVARDREVDGDLILGDLGEGLPFRAGTFDGAISISALQVKPVCNYFFCGTIISVKSLNLYFLWNNNLS